MLLALCACAAAAAAQQTDFNVLDFGAVGDGKHDDTTAIQAAIAATAAAAPAGCAWQPRVLLPYGHTFLSRPLWLASCTDFHVEGGATLVSGTKFTDYPVVWKASGFGQAIVGFVNGARCVANSTTQCTQWAKLENVTLSGEGTIDGSGPAWWDASNWWPTLPRPMLLDLFWIQNLVVRDLTLTRAAEWTLQPSLCTNVLIDGIRIEAGNVRDGIPYIGNNVDGLDSNNVRNLTLQNSVIHAGDDCVALNSRNHALPEEFPTRGVLIRNLTCATPISLGSGTGNGVFDVRIEDSVVDPLAENFNLTDAWLPKWWRTAVRFKTARGRGTAPIANVTISNLTVNAVDLVLDFQSYYSCQNSSGTDNYMACRAATQPPPAPPGTPGPTFANITVTGVRGSAWRAGWLNCLPERPCTGIRISDFNVTGNPIYPSSATAANGWVCEHVYGTASNDVSPAPLGCFQS